MDIDLAFLREHWNKCPFCGASKGLYGFPKEQHRLRCRYKGNANTTKVRVPNYLKMIEESDRTFLPMMRARAELPLVESRLVEAERKLAILEAKSPPK